MIHLVTTKELSLSTSILEKDFNALFEYWKDKESVAVDTETTGFDQFNDKLLTVQLGDINEQWVIDCETMPILQLKELLESKLTLYHNFAFDGKWLYKQGIDCKKIYDSFLAECLLTAGYDTDKRNLGLNDVSKKYLKTEISKEDRGLIHREGFTERVLEYCAKDVRHLHQIKEAQAKEISNWGLDKVLQLENNVARPFMLMMYNGVLIDSNKWLKVAEFVEAEVSKIGNTLDDIVIAEKDNFPRLNSMINNQISMFSEFEGPKTFINWKSPDQKKKILNIMGMNVNSVNEKILQRNKKHEIVKKMIEFSKHAKFEDTFGRNFLKSINRKTGRIHGEIFQIVSTGRISISDPPLQQIPAHGDIAMKIKDCFIAREGYTLVDTDVSGFEIVIATEFSQEPRWIDILNSNGDIHTETAMLMFEIPRDKVNEPFPERPNYSYRFIAKSCNFLAMYGGNEFTLSDRIQIPKQRAKQLLNAYFSKLPKLHYFLKMIAKTAAHNGRIRSNPYYSRLRFFPNLDPDDWTTVSETEREAMNMPMQGTNADLIKESIVNIQSEIDNKLLDVLLLLQIHDAILDEVRDDLVSEWIPVKEKIMIDTISKYIKSVPIKVKTTYGKSWKH